MKRKNERGEVVVEASIVVTIVLLFLTVFLYIGMVLYQQALVTIVANQTASSIAQLYGNNIRDPFTGYIDPDSVYQSITYSSMKSDAYTEVLVKKAETMAFYRLKSSRILTNGAPQVEVKLEKKPNELMKYQIIVEIRDRYQVPLVSVFGINNNTLSFSAVGKADCVDLLEYLNGVEAIGDPDTSNVRFLPNLSTCFASFYTTREAPTPYAIVEVMKGKSICTSYRYTHSKMPPDPQNGTYRFSGWTDETGALYLADVSKIQIDNNISFYGSWNCRVILDPDGGRVNGSERMEITVKAGNPASFPSATREGYAFTGWYTERGGSGTRYITNSTRIERDITLYAGWQCTHEGETGYTFVERHGVKCTDEHYDLYRCQRCGTERREAFEGEHNTKGRCNKNHIEFGWQHWNGTCGEHSFMGAYHVTCTGCGRVATHTGFVEVRGVIYQYWYWCGAHYPRGLQETATH